MSYLDAPRLQIKVAFTETDYFVGNFQAISFNTTSHTPRRHFMIF